MQPSRPSQVFADPGSASVPGAAGSEVVWVGSGVVGVGSAEVGGVDGKTGDDGADDGADDADAVGAAFERVAEVCGPSVRRTLTSPPPASPPLGSVGVECGEEAVAAFATVVRAVDAVADLLGVGALPT